MYQVPSAVVILVKTNPAPVLVAVILAPGTTDPVLSMTAPTMVAVPVEDCATRLTATRANESRSRRNMWDSFWGMLSRVKEIVNRGIDVGSHSWCELLSHQRPSRKPGSGMRLVL